MTTERAVALLELVEELHRRGLQRLRVLPYLAPSGLYWRLQLDAPGREKLGLWSTADDPPSLAELLALDGLEEGRGDDPAYAAWLSHAVELARAGWLLYFFADWPTDAMAGVPLLGPADGKPVLEEPPGGR